MSALFIAFVITVLLNSSMQAKIFDDNGDDLIEEFRDLFSEFLQRQPSKHIRDTSGAKQKKPDIKVDRDKTIKERSTDRPNLLPLYHCNHFDASARSCVNIRQLGTTLTVGVRVEDKKNEKRRIHWYRFYKIRGEDADKSLKFVKLTRGNLPWNINIGGENSEIRISPITETDFSYNFFLATLNEGRPGDVQADSKKHLQLLKFSIEPISIDMGTLYHGEEITINVRSHMELPRRSVRYEWATVGRGYTVNLNLPSNMKLSRDGSAVIIKEHRSYGDMLLTCAVFSNKNFTLARRSFFLRKIVLVKNPNVKVKSEPNFSRKRRYLDDFYAQPNWDEAIPLKSKRDFNFPGDVDQDITIEAQRAGEQKPQSNQSMPLDVFSEINNPMQESTEFAIVDKPQETVLNFYGNPSDPENFASETEVPQVSEKKQKLKSQSLDGLIEQANDIVESTEVRNGQEYPKSKIIVEERLTAEDRESLMIAFCNDDSDCGINAICFSIERNKKFCRCKPHYRGNGMFCWLF